MSDVQAVLRGNLRAFRRLRKLSQGELAAQVTALGYPLNQTIVSRLESGTRAATVEELFVVAMALNVSPIALLLPGDARHVVKIGSVSVPAAQVYGWTLGYVPLEPTALGHELYRQALPRWLAERGETESRSMEAWFRRTMQELNAELRLRTRRAMRNLSEEPTASPQEESLVTKTSKTVRNRRAPAKSAGAREAKAKALLARAQKETKP